MAELDTYQDRLVAFEAIKASDTDRLALRQPRKHTLKYPRLGFHELDSAIHDSWPLKDLVQLQL